MPLERWLTLNEAHFKFKSIAWILAGNGGVMKLRHRLDSRSCTKRNHTGEVRLLNIVIIVMNCTFFVHGIFLFKAKRLRPNVWIRGIHTHSVNYTDYGWAPVWVCISTLLLDSKVYGERREESVKNTFSFVLQENVLLCLNFRTSNCVRKRNNQRHGCVLCIVCSRFQ